MTDKQIIIDGVDVSGCTDFDKETGHCLTGFRTDEQPFCNCFTCSYKKYKAKEQECEELKVYKSITPLKVKMLVKALREIKDCFDNYKKEQDYLSFVNEFNQILQKISEVEDDNA